jgi:sRNA-binding protein
VSITAASNALTAELVARYPAFAAVLPLTVGAKNQMLAAGFDPVMLRKAVYKHVMSTAYLRKLAKGGKRYNLDGTEAEDIDPEQAEKANVTLTERIRKTIEEMRQKKQNKALEDANRLAKAEQLAKTAANAKKAGKAMPVAQAAAKVVKPAPAAKPVQPFVVATPVPSVAVIVKKKRIVVIPK